MALTSTPGTFTVGQTTGMFNTSFNRTAVLGGKDMTLSAPQWILILAIPVIILVGTVGNLLSMVVLLRPKFRSVNVNVYLVGLAVADTVFLWCNSLTRFFIRQVLGIGYSTISIQACRTYVYLLYTSKCLSAWFIVVVTIQRLLVVLFPFKTKKLVGRKSAFMVVVILILVVFAIYAFVPMMYTVAWDPEYEEDRCQVTQFYKDKGADVILKLMDLLIYSLLPTIALSVSNALLVYRLVASVRFRQANTDGKTGRQDQGARRLTITLILISCCFLVFTLPFSAFLLHSTIHPEVANFSTLYLSFYVLEVLNSAVNFLLYCASGPAFRAELRLGVSTVFGACRTCSTRVSKGRRKEDPSGHVPSLKYYVRHNDVEASGPSSDQTASTDDIVAQVEHSI